ncbi:hypothetical protein C8Q79DRAFT_927198 [Trametes meyenii]|nr:hypothetical protein C8Q79DRAFT_927198 [Trametes meyenii]
MSTKNYFVVTLIDLPGSVEARKKHSAAHYQSPLVSGNIIRIGIEKSSTMSASEVAGLLLQPGTLTTDADAAEKVQGSLVIAQAESVDKVWEVLKVDPYWTQGVWDQEKTTVVPVIVAKPKLE